MPIPFILPVIFSSNIKVPDNILTNLKPNVPIIITTHETKIKSLKKVLIEIEKLDFVVSKIVTISIDKSIT